MTALGLSLGVCMHAQLLGMRNGWYTALYVHWRLCLDPSGHAGFKTASVYALCAAGKPGGGAPPARYACLY